MKKLTINDIQSKIKKAEYVRIDGSTITLAVLTLSNGHVVTGQSACLNPADFDEALGRKIAYENAEGKIWELEGYLRREQAFQNAVVVIPAVVVHPHDDLTAFIGTKIVNAKPMTRAIYNQFRGWELPSDENGDDEGYLVEYTDAQRPNAPGFAGYVSWSPKDVFDLAYHALPASTAPTPSTGTANTEVLDDNVTLTNTNAATGPVPFA